MKKNIFAIAVVGVTMCGLSAFADVPAANTAEKATSAAIAFKSNPDKEKKSPFDSLNLTAAQKTKLEALKAQQTAERKQAMDKKKAEAKAAKQRKIAERKQAMEQKRAAAKTARQQRIAERAKLASQKREAKLNYLHKVKAILTPEQYVTYLENMVAGQDGVKGKPAMQSKKRDGRMAMQSKKCDCKKAGKMRGDKNKQFDKSQRPQKDTKPNKDGKK